MQSAQIPGCLGPGRGHGAPSSDHLTAAPRRRCGLQDVTPVLADRGGGCGRGRARRRSCPVPSDNNDANGDAGPRTDSALIPADRGPGRSSARDARGRFCAFPCPGDGTDGISAGRARGSRRGRGRTPRACRSPPFPGDDVHAAAGDAGADAVTVATAISADRGRRHGRGCACGRSGVRDVRGRFHALLYHGDNAGAAQAGHGADAQGCLSSSASMLTSPHVVGYRRQRRHDDVSSASPVSSRRRISSSQLFGCDGSVSHSTITSSEPVVELSAGSANRSAASMEENERRRHEIRLGKRPMEGAGVRSSTVHCVPSSPSFGAHDLPHLSTTNSVPIYDDDMAPDSMPSSGDFMDLDVQDDNDFDGAIEFDDGGSIVAGAPFVPAHRATANRRMRTNIRRHRAFLRAGYRLRGRLPTSAEFISMLKREWRNGSYAGYPHHLCKLCGASFWYKERCKKLSTERKIKRVVCTRCCRRGKVLLPVYPDWPPPLAELLHFDGDARSRKFMRLIREYNSMFAFTSLGVHVDTSVNVGRGPYVFKICGVVCHQIGSLLPPAKNPMPKFSQLYIYDTEHELDRRLHLFSTGGDEVDGSVPLSGGTNSSIYRDRLRSSRKEQPDLEVVDSIRTMLNECNPLVQTFRMAEQRLFSPNCPDVSIRLFGHEDLYVVEFQKRGLPHIHSLVWLKKDTEDPTPATIDSYISAEIPDYEDDMLGYSLVEEFMVHGPCGEYNPNSPCMKDGKCTKHYPKDFNEETTMDGQGFPVYRRPKNGRYVTKNGVRLDNRWIVPYNMALLKKFQAHINVEWRNKTNLIKYIFKYIAKGHDMARVGLQSTTIFSDPHATGINEIEDYAKSRYVSTCEADWRIFGFEIHGREPAVERLVVHLPNMNRVIYNENENLIDVVANPNKYKTMLTEWFIANQRHEDARHLTYLDFPSEWTWDESTRLWKKRIYDKKFGPPIGRIYNVHPTTNELFFFRMLLNIVQGATSFEDIRTYNGQLYASYKAACEARGLVGNDNEWFLLFDEAIQWASSFQLRHLFMTVVLFCGVNNGQRLLDSYSKYMSDDIAVQIIHSLGDTSFDIPSEYLHSQLLQELSVMFGKNGYSLSSFNIFTDSPAGAKLLQNRLLLEEMQYDKDYLRKTSSTLHAKLNLEQKCIFDQIMNSVSSSTGKLFFISGHGGTGKTFLWNTIITALRADDNIVLEVASSGVASLFQEVEQPTLDSEYHWK